MEAIMDISTIIKKDIIFFNLKASTQEEVIDAMIERVATNGYVSDKGMYHAAVNERESKSSTAIGYGVAIPHGKSDGVVSPFIAFAKLSTPVEWNSFDGKPVTTVFMIGVPKNAGKDHLKILIAISKSLMHDEFRDALEKEDTAEGILNVLKAINE
jgi:fructose PTS system EIIA component